MVNAKHIFFGHYVKVWSNSFLQIQEDNILVDIKWGY